MTLKVVFFGSSPNVFSQRFFAALAQTACKIAAIVDVPAARRSSSNPSQGKSGLNYAEEAVKRGVPVYEPSDPNQPEFVAAMRTIKPDLFLAVGYMFRMKAELLSVPRLVSANVHASLLPDYRGRSPVFWALRNGERFSGLSVHSMDDELDRGNLMYQVRVRTRKDDTVASLYDRIIDRSLKVVPELILAAECGRFPLIRPPESVGSYFSAPKEADFRLDWSRGSEELRRWITITPGQCFTEIRGQRIFFSDAKMATVWRKGVPGTLLEIGLRNCTIATGEGALRIGAIRLQDGELMPMSQFCEQTGLRIGDDITAWVQQEVACVEVG